MHVGIDLRPVLTRPTGVGEYLMRLVPVLVRQAPEDRFLLFSSSWRDRLRGWNHLAPNAVAIDRRIPVRVLNLLWHRLGRPSLDRLSGTHIDVSHSPHPLILPTRRGAAVVTIHDLYFLRHPEHTAAEVRRDYPRLVRSHARRATRIIVPSAFTAAEVERELEVARDRIDVIPHGATILDEQADADSILSRHRLVPGYILCVGTLEPRKNVSMLLDAYQRLAERDRPPLVLAGEAGAAADSVLVRLAAGIPGVRPIGYVEPAERTALYRHAAVLALPSLEEGFGLPLLEAMAAGLPAVVSDAGALPEVAGGAAVLVDPHDPAEFAERLRQVLGDRALAAGLAARARARAQAFSWVTAARDTLGCYRRAFADHTGQCA